MAIGHFGCALVGAAHSCRHQIVGICPGRRREKSLSENASFPKLQLCSVPKRSFSPANRPAKSTLTGISPSPDDYHHGPKREATRSTKTEIADPEESAV